MTFPDVPRVIYERNPIVEVICQLRFPPILKIVAEPPAQFQERLRQEYPVYSEQGIDRGLGDLPDEVQRLAEAAFSSFLQRDRAVEHVFASEDEQWKITLASNFVALTTRGYVRWENYSGRLTSVIEALSEVYSPTFFTRVGLRYKDLISRSTLQKSGVSWNELLRPHIAGELNDQSIDENAIKDLRRGLLIEVADGLTLLLQHGLVHRTLPEGIEEAEYSYLLDMDFYKEGRTDAGDVPALLDRANREAGRLFRWCITEQLHDALGPNPV